MQISYLLTISRKWFIELKSKAIFCKADITMNKMTGLNISFQINAKKNFALPINQQEYT